MTWAAWLVAVAAVIYVAASIAYAVQKNFGMALVFFAYALANVGLMIVGER